MFISKFSKCLHNTLGKALWKLIHKIQHHFNLQIPTPKKNFIMWGLVQNVAKCKKPYQAKEQKKNKCKKLVTSYLQLKKQKQNQQIEMQQEKERSETWKSPKGRILDFGK